VRLPVSLVWPEKRLERNGYGVQKMRWDRKTTNHKNTCDVEYELLVSVIMDIASHYKNVNEIL
jgi:hypothetical protein